MTRDWKFESRTVVLVLALVLVAGVLLFNSFGTGASANVVAPAVEFSGGTFEASGVAHVPGTAGVLFVDDGRPEEIFWMGVSEGRTQSGPIKSIRLGVSVIDLEGMTTDGSHFYIVGSQSKPTGADLAGLVRFKFNPDGQSLEGVEAISGLKKFLADNVAELRGMSDRKYSDGGINVEGIAWDPKSKRLLLGLRSPVVDGHALIVPLRLRDPKGAFSQENLMVEDSKSIRLPLGQTGIRSIEYDESRNAFCVISGAAANSEKADFKLWEWNGDAAQPALRETDTFDRKLKPEGITRFSANGREFSFIVFDTSRYAALD